MRYHAAHMNTRTKNILIVVAVLVVLLLGYGVWRERGAQSAGSVATSTISIATTTLTNATSAPAYTIQSIPVASAPAVPDYKTPLACASNIPADQCAQFTLDANTYAAQIAMDATSGPAWINLGTVRESAGDYTGAIAAWNYVKALYPTSPTAYDNLGDVYMNYVHDYSKSESNYLASIKIYPHDPAPYTNLFMLYTTTSYVPSATAAENILKAGIVANPKAVNLQVILARYYKTSGRTSDAKTEYAAAIANAQSQGLAALADQIRTESSTL
jgi:tetratricopeptide (TPR) repeat protein